RGGGPPEIGPRGSGRNPGSGGVRWARGPPPSETPQGMVFGTHFGPPWRAGEDGIVAADGKAGVNVRAPVPNECPAGRATDKDRRRCGSLCWGAGRRPAGAGGEDRVGRALFERRGDPPCGG